MHLSIADVDRIPLWLAEQFNFDIDARNDWGETALVSLCREGSFEEEETRLDMLLNLEINVNLPDYKGKTALMHAARNYAVVKRLLLDEGADHASRDQEGRTALFHTHGCFQTSSLLCKMGADANAVDVQGKNVFEYWYEIKNQSICKSFFFGTRASPDDCLRQGLNKWKDRQGQFLCEEFLAIEKFVPTYVKNFIDSSEVDGNSPLFQEARDEWGHHLYGRFCKDVVFVRRLECLCAIKCDMNVALLPDKVKNHVKTHLYTLQILRNLDGMDGR